jgi:hypothetical protein
LKPPKGATGVDGTPSLAPNRREEVATLELLAAERLAADDHARTRRDRVEDDERGLAAELEAQPCRPPST